MRALPKPEYDVNDLYGMCFRGVANAARRARFEMVAGSIRDAIHEYERAGTEREFFLLPAHGDINGIASAHDMIWLYTHRFAKKKSAGRHVYDALLASAGLGKCPLCGHRVASTLDHYLPKSSHPVYAIAPQNLVPACKDCNWLKLERAPTSVEDQTLHPYYDNIDDNRWLAASLMEETPPALVFAAEPPAHWDRVVAERTRNHFVTFGLAELFATHAAEELVATQHLVRMLFAAGGSVAVRSHLAERADAYSSTSVNSWQTAMFTTLAANDWFCRGGSLGL